ncbi:LysM peptidoglycan-binding domain-containing protein [Maritimibacter dapengensis]|uniref:LysM peptidoglycan-binding domain-containing protein n=1 Tax=Maritimibacter dapengensis TaxID=2836868 RepID=UPI0021065C0D|nr:LysM peptidoglycan-binding domain-containing protein [Maritimibacter dapengensis]
MSSSLQRWLGWTLGACAAVALFIASVWLLQGGRLEPPTLDKTMMRDDQAVVVGTATPGSQVQIYVDQEILAEVTTSETGEFVAVFDLPNSDAARTLRAAVRRRVSGEPVFGADSIIIPPAEESPSMGAETPDEAPEADMMSEAAPETVEEPEITAQDREEADRPDAEESAATDAEDTTGPVEPETTGTAEAAPDAPQPVTPPTFGNIRFPSDGIAVVAGRADPGSEVVVFVDGEEVARETANASGDFAALFDLAVAQAPRIVRLATRREGEGELVYAEETRIVEPRTRVVAEVQPEPEDEPTPVAPDTPEAEVVEPADAEAPAAQDAEQPAVAETQDQLVASEPDEEVAETATDTSQEPTTSAAPAQEPEAVPAPPRVLEADREGIRVVDAPSSTGGPELTLDAIAYDENGEAVVSGRAVPGAPVRVYLDNERVGDTQADDAGQWRLTLPETVSAGVYTMRVDQLNAEGGVVARLDTPFKREDREVLAALLGIEAPTAPEVAAETAEAVRTPAASDAPDTTGATPETQAPTAAENTTDTQPPATPSPAPEIAAPEAEAVAQAPDASGDAPDQPQVTQANAPDATPPPTELAQAVAPDTPEEEPLIAAITVQPGSTLWAIARARYGEGLLYVEVFEANKDQIRDPDLIYPGQVFDLPTGITPATE